MNWLKHNLLFASVLLAVAALLATETWLWSRARAQARRALAALEQKQVERDGLARQAPALSEENEQAIAHDLAGTQLVVAALRAALQGRDDRRRAAEPPSTPVELYFDLAAFVEKSRTLAARAQVTVRPDEHFGFATHANEGPEADVLPTVFRQRIGGQYLVETLLESHPRALLAVQRERPVPAAQRNQPPAMPSGSSAAADFFAFDEQISVRVPGRVDSEAFRLEFTGQTPALRTFLNSLATFQLPVVVRSVEVEPLGVDAASSARLASGDTASRPLVAQNLSRFVVIVEVLTIRAATGVPAS